MRMSRLDLGGNLSVGLKQVRSDFPGHTRIQLEFSDGYLSDLAQEHGWTQDQCRKFPEQLFAKMGQSAPVIHQQDKELFTVDLPDSSSSNPLEDVRQALREATEHPESVRTLLAQEQAREAAGKRACEALQAETSKIRHETCLMRAYKRDPQSSSPSDHRGFCIVDQVRVTRARGLNRAEERFLGEDKRAALKDGMVLLCVSLAQAPLRALYGGRSIPVNGPYDSDLRKLIEGLAQPGELVKIEARPSIQGMNNRAAGEEARLLCKESLATRLVAELRQRNAGLDDPMAPAHTQGFEVAGQSARPARISPFVENVSTPAMLARIERHLKQGTRQEALALLSELKAENIQDHREFADLYELCKNLAEHFLDPQSATVAAAIMRETVYFTDSLTTAEAFLSAPPQAPPQRWKCAGRALQAMRDDEGGAPSARAALSLLRPEIGESFHDLLGSGEGSALWRIAGKGLEMLGEQPGISPHQLALDVTAAIPGEDVLFSLVRWGTCVAVPGHAASLKREMQAAATFEERCTLGREFLEDLRDGHTSTRAEREALQAQLRPKSEGGVQHRQGFSMVGGTRLRHRNAHG
ncbi:hypothetical protein DYH09_23915 [bacterium CPR1]|nr:hypothetical protein [bacterium CPR1]